MTSANRVAKTGVTTTVATARSRSDASAPPPRTVRFAGPSITTETKMYMTQTSPLPDPVDQPEFYQTIPTKRLLAWVVDVVLIGILTAIVIPFTLFIGLLILPFLYATISFIYRWVSLARSSATPGMRLMAIHFRDNRGAPLDSGTALFHTLGYFVSVAVFPLQLISIITILLIERHQSLTDMVLGTTALNR